MWLALQRGKRAIRLGFEERFHAVAAHPGMRLQRARLVASNANHHLGHTPLPSQQGGQNRGTAQTGATPDPRQPPEHAIDCPGERLRARGPTMPLRHARDRSKDAPRGDELECRRNQQA